MLQPRKRPFRPVATRACPCRLKSYFLSIKQDLSAQLVENLYGEDRKWIQDRNLIGEPDRQARLKTNRGLCGQRGIRFV
jgi:hypothetical protein